MIYTTLDKITKVVVALELSFTILLGDWRTLLLGDKTGMGNSRIEFCFSSHLYFSSLFCRERMIG